ncbi:hypothetical protein ES703_121393 [subsurface metagenome]
MGRLVTVIVAAAAGVATYNDKVSGIKLGYFCSIESPPVPVVRVRRTFPPVIDVVALSPEHVHKALIRGSICYNSIGIFVVRDPDDGRGVDRRRQAKPQHQN